jgi:hypothetical protein
MDFWKEPVFWQAFAAIVAVLALVNNFKKHYSKKLLAVEIVHTQKVLLIDKDLKEKIHVFFNGVLMKNPVIYTFKVMNYGNVIINESDYTEPLIFHFTEGTRIASVEKRFTYFDTAIPKYETENSTIKILPLLLNPSDKFYIRILCFHDDEYPEPGFRVRISGGKVSGSLFKLEEVFALGILTLLFSLMILLLSVFNIPVQEIYFVLLVSITIVAGGILTYKLILIIMNFIHDNQIIKEITSKIQ